MRTLLIISGMLLSLAISAGDKVYKSVDEKGNVIFSDTPTDNSKEITVPPASTFKPPVLPYSLRRPSRGEDTYSYTILEITSPENDKVFVNEEANSIAVHTRVEPNKRYDHKLVLRVDSEVQSEMSLSNLDRGTHTLVAEIINAAGDVVISSDPVQIHVKRHIIKKATPPPPPPPAPPPNPSP